MFRRKRDRVTDAEDVARHDPGLDLVEVGAFGAIEAELVAGKLRESGIDAVVFGSGAEGAYPHLVFAEGSRVMVRRRDAEAAAALLRD
jgi:hypothetical protein